MILIFLAAVYHPDAKTRKISKLFFHQNFYEIYLICVVYELKFTGAWKLHYVVFILLSFSRNCKRVFFIQLCLEWKLHRGDSVESFLPVKYAKLLHIVSVVSRWEKNAEKCIYIPSFYAWVECLSNPFLMRPRLLNYFMAGASRFQNFRKNFKISWWLFSNFIIFDVFKSVFYWAFNVLLMVLMFSDSIKNFHLIYWMFS